MERATIIEQAGRNHATARVAHMNWNADKSGCNRCKYGRELYRNGRVHNSIYCAYSIMTGRARMLICTPENCTVYERAKGRKEDAR